MIETNYFTKLKSVAKILRIIFRVLFWVSLVALVVFFIGEVVIMFLPKEYFLLSNFYEGDISFEIDGILQFNLTEEYSSTINIKTILLLMIPSMAVSTAFYLVIFKQMQSILKSIMVDRPFDEKNSKSLFVMSIAFMLAAFLFSISESFFFAEVLSVIGTDCFESSCSPDLNLLITGILLLILSNVFKYGNYLQKEFDQTV